MLKDKKRYSIGQAPMASISVGTQRSRFDLSHTIFTSGVVGKVIPIDFQDVVPGDTFKVNTNAIIRPFVPTKFPVMDTLQYEISH